MKKTLALVVLVLFVLSNLAFAAPPIRPGAEKTKTKVMKVEKVKAKKVISKEKGKVEAKAKVKGRKTEPPKGVKKAAEKGKGEKKGLWQRWFGKSKEKKEPAKK